MNNIREANFNNEKNTNILSWLISPLLKVASMTKVAQYNILIWLLIINMKIRSRQLRNRIIRKNQKSQPACFMRFYRGVKSNSNHFRYNQVTVSRIGTLGVVPVRNS